MPNKNFGLTAKIIWGALSASMFMYGYILIVMDKMNHVELISSTNSLLEQMALLYNGAFLVTFFTYKKLVSQAKDLQKKLTSYIICWALHEGVVIIGFTAVFLSDSGNGFFYALNLTMALIGNMLTFPRGFDS